MITEETIKAIQDIVNGLKECQLSVCIKREISSIMTVHSKGKKVVTFVVTVEQIDSFESLKHTLQIILGYGVIARINLKCFDIYVNSEKKQADFTLLIPINKRGSYDK